MNILEKLCFNPTKAEIFEGSIFWVAQSDPHTHTHTHTHKIIFQEVILKVTKNRVLASLYLSLENKS